MTIWVLKDNRIGSSKQAEFLAKAIGKPYEVKNIVYNKYITLPNFLKPNRVGVDFEKSDSLFVANIDVDSGRPDVIIFAGRRLAGIAVYLKEYHEKSAKKPVKLISILNPNLPFKNFDVILLPYHDTISKKNKYKNLINFTGALCNSDLKITKEVSDYWGSKLELCRKPLILWVIGGDVKNKRMNSKKIGDITAKISDMVLGYNGTLLVTTSRRTSEKCIAEIKANIACDNLLYIFGEKGAPNPYNLFLTKCDTVIVTCDSISMVSEIATLGKNLYMYIPNEVVKEKHRIFCKNMFEKSVAKPFDFNTEKLETINMKKLDEITEIVEQIKGMIDL